MPLNILHVTEAAVGGVVSVLEELLPIQCGTPGVASVSLLAPHRALTAFEAEPVRCLPFGFKARSPAGIVQLTRRIRQAIDANPPDILHLHSSFAGLAGRLALVGMRHRPGVIYCAHAWSFARTGQGLSNSIARLIERRLANRTDRILCVSEGDRQAGIRIGIAPGKLDLVYNGIRDLPYKLAIPAREHWPGPGLKLLFIGRYDRQKAYDVLMRSMEQLGLRASLLSVGDFAGDSPQTLRCPDNVRRLGWVPRHEIPALLGAADIVVMPSRWEGLPMAGIEAFRSGKGVVGSAHPLL